MANSRLLAALVSATLIPAAAGAQDDVLFVTGDKVGIGTASRAPREGRRPGDGRREGRKRWKPQMHAVLQKGGHRAVQHGCWQTFTSTYQGPSIAGALMLHDSVDPRTQVS